MGARPGAHALLRMPPPRLLSSEVGAPKSTFEPLGKPKHERDAAAEEEDDGASAVIEGPSTERRRPPRAGRAGGFQPGGGGGSDAGMLQFQAYVRRRMAEIDQQMYKTSPTARERAELSFLEEQVIEDHMTSARRKLRDPLKDTPLAEITHTNLPLLCRFVTDGGAILPRKITGVNAKKQRALAKAIKRAQVLALMPKIWKLPQYRHASYADDFSKPERFTSGGEDPDFKEPADLRFPGQLESSEPSLNLELAWLARQK
tara:strand:+ start:57 stop:833 length:777 start_codon:yes stop_codon:yes gene_type:complete